MRSIDEYLRRNLRYVDVRENSYSHNFILKGFNGTNQVNKFFDCSDVRFIRSNMIDNKIVFLNNETECYLIWDENCWNILGTFILLFNEATKQIQADKDIVKTVNLLCGNFFFMLSLKYKNFSTLTKLLKLCAEFYGFSDAIFNKYKLLANREEIVYCSKEFALFHEINHLANKKTNRMSIELIMQFVEVIKANVHNIYPLLRANFDDGTEKQYLHELLVLLDNQNNPVFDELGADVFTIIETSNYIKKSSSKLLLSYNSMKWLMTFNTYFNFINELWNSHYSCIRTKNLDFSKVLLSDADIRFRTLLGICRSYWSQTFFDYCVKEKSIRLQKTYIYLEYVKGRKFEEKAHDLIFNEFSHIMLKRMLDIEAVQRIIKLSVLIDNNEIMLSDDIVYDTLFCD